MALLALSMATPQESAARENAHALLLRVVGNQERNQELQRQYTYHETVTTQNLRKDGTVKKRTEETFQVLPAPGGEYRKLVARNGRPLSTKEREKEERKFQRYLKKQLELSPEEIKKKNENLKKRVGRFEARIREALEVFEFLPLPDETLKGRRLRVFDFSPRPHYRPHSRATKLLSCTEGRAWIDPERNQIVKLHMRFNKDVKFLLGLFGRISKGTEAVAQQQHLGDEVWLLDRVEVLLKGRFYFVKRYNKRLTFDYSSYEKYTVTTEEKITPPVTRPPH